MGGGALIMSMLSTEAPTACLPKGAFFDPVTRCVLVTPEAVWEDYLVSSTSLPKYDAVFQIVFPFLNIRWALGGENAWNPIIMGGKEKSGGGRGMCGEEVLLEVGVDRAGGKMSFHYKEVSLSSSFLLLQF